METAAKPSVTLAVPSVVSYETPLPHTRPELLDALRQRARSMHGRGRVAEALYGLALDMLGDEGRLHPAERRWLRDALSGPVSEAAHEAVDVLLRELTDVLSSAPARLRPLAYTSVSRIDFE